MVYFTGHSQMDDYQRDIIDLMRSNGTQYTYGIVYDEIFVSLRTQFAKSEVPESFWEQLRRDRKAQIDMLLPDLSFGYRKHFKHDEIKELDAFFEGKAMQEAVRLHQNYYASEDPEIQKFWQSELGRKYQAKQPELTEDLDQIAHYWKTDIFKNKMSRLIKAGYWVGRN